MIISRMLAIALLLIFAAGYIYTDKQETRYKHSIKPLIKSMMDDISHWQAATLFQYLAPEAKAITNQETLDNMITHYKPLGELKQINSIHFSKLSSALSLLGPKRINYSGSATFESGQAEFSITLINSNQQWLIYNFTLKH